MRPRTVGLSARLALMLVIGVAVGVLGLGYRIVAAATVDVSFERAPVHEVLRVLAEAEGINLIVDQDVEGEVSMSARALMAREAIDLVAALRGLHVEQVGNTLVVSRESMGLTSRMSRIERPQLKFTERPVREVLEALADRAGWNLISEASLNQAVTAWLEGMEYVEALRLVAASAGLRYQLVDGVLHIKGSASDGGGDRVAIHRLDHVDPRRAKELIEAFVPGARVEVDSDTRSLVTSGPVSLLEDVASFLGAFDTPRPQVLVEARILEVAVDALDSLGVEWSELLAFAGSGTPATFQLSWNPDQLQATLRSLAERGRSKVLASPKISAIDDETARMLIGDRVPIVTEHTDSEGRVTQSVEYIDVGIVLEIEPSIASDGSVTLAIRTEVSSVVDPASRFPTVRTREATSRVRVKDGQPLIIGGLIQEEEREQLSGIPYLNELPVLGSLFGRRVNENVQTETLIILIPHIINDDIEGHEGDRVRGDSIGSGEAPGAALRLEATNAALGALEAPALARLERASDRLAVSVGLLSLGEWAAEMQLEKEKGRYSYISRLYGALDSSSQEAWSVGAGLRLYIGDDGPPPFLRPWIDGGIEYAAPVSDEPLTVYTASAGFRLTVGEHGLVELYARHQEPSRAEALIDLPGRASSRHFGLRLGWRY